MAPAPVEDRLRHIQAAIDRIETLTTGKDFSTYAADWVIRDAVERDLERLSEASRHIPAPLKSRHRTIGWRSISALGNVLRHEYPHVVNERVWQIVTHDLAPLKTIIDDLLRDLEKQDG